MLAAMSEPASEHDLPAIPAATGVARSLENARQGQMLLVDEVGNVTKPIIPSGIGSVFLVALGAVVALQLLANLVVMITGIQAAAYLAPIGFVALWVSYVWTVRGLRQALARIGSGDLVGAEKAALSVAKSRLMFRMVRGNAWMLAGAARGLRGDHREALALTQRGLRELPVTGKQRGLAVLTRLNEIQYLALTSERSRASERLAELEREGLADGDLVRMQWLDTRLVLAFEAGDTSTLPDEDELEAWARDALATNRFGSTLVLLAWALTDRGKPELVPVLLDVARDRLPECHIETAHPRLAAWYRAATTAHPQ